MQLPSVEVLILDIAGVVWFLVSSTNQTDPGLSVAGRDDSSGFPTSISLVAIFPLTSDKSLTFTLLKVISLAIVLF